MRKLILLFITSQLFSQIQIGDEIFGGMVFYLDENNTSGKVTSFDLGPLCPLEAESYCAEYNVGGYSDWYMASTSDLVDMFYSLCIDLYPGGDASAWEYNLGQFDWDDGPTNDCCPGECWGRMYWGSGCGSCGGGGGGCDWYQIDACSSQDMTPTPFVSGGTANPVDEFHFRAIRDFYIIYGCTDSDACNYDDEANVDNGSCEYAEDGYDCDGNCDVDINCFGQCGAPCFTFTKEDWADWTLPENQDCITENVCITRADETIDVVWGSIFNAVLQDGYGDDSPVGTEWAMGHTEDVSQEDYVTWTEIWGSLPTPMGLLGQIMSLYLIEDDIYFDIVFNSWTEESGWTSFTSGGGGFSYVRSFVSGEVEGGDCMLETACNYDPDATTNILCEMPDCNGNCGGGALVDECGVCEGDGSTCVVFRKENWADWTLPENQDCITDNVCITRPNEEGIFNAVLQNSCWDGENPCNPAGTLWAIGHTAEVSLEDYEPWALAVEWSPPVALGVPMSLYLIEDDIYFDIVFNSWTCCGEGGGFSYTRIPTDCAGVPNGDAVEDCAGECNGDAVIDECGVCGGMGVDADADGICDDVDECIEDADASQECGCNTGIPDGACNCVGDVDLGCGCGVSAPDECGTCDGSIVDLGCGCSLPGPSGCDETCGSTLEFDECGICDGDNTSCADCAGVPNGDAVIDECGICDGDGPQIYYADSDGDGLGEGEGDLYCESVIFIKENYSDWTLAENQDRITDNVWITRKNNQSIFNIAQESAYSGGNGSPVDTEWALGETSGASSDDYANFVAMHGGNPSSIVDQTVSLHLISDDLYYDVIFTHYQGGNNGGGFSYIRNVPSGYVLNDSDLEPDCATNDTDACGECAGNGIAEACGCDDTSGLNVDGCCDDVVLGCDGVCFSGLVEDCEGECGGSLVIDDCGVCGGENADELGCGCFEDAPTGCDNACGSTVEFDECGICDGDNSTCSGCTNPEADNFDQTAIVDDESCLYLYTINLHSFSNLISFIVLPDDISVGSVLESLDGIVYGIVGQGAAAQPDPTLGWIGSLYSINNENGYWIKMSEPGVLSILSHDYPGTLNPTYNLNFGANLISYPFDGEFTLLETIPMEVMPYITDIIAEGEAAQQNQTLGWVGSLSTLQGSKGYWFKVTEPIEFQFINP